MTPAECDGVSGSPPSEAEIQAALLRLLELLAEAVAEKLLAEFQASDAQAR
jgi:hypothetical protein